MCDECHQNPHAHTCPNNPNFYEERTVICKVCEKEYPEDEMLWSVCDECISRSTTFDLVRNYGLEHMAKTELNPLWVKFFSPEQIDMILLEHAVRTKKFFPDVAERYVREVVTDDEGSFAEWLVEQREKGGG